MIICGDLFLLSYVSIVFINEDPYARTKALAYSEPPVY